MATHQPKKSLKRAPTQRQRAQRTPQQPLWRREWFLKLMGLAVLIILVAHISQPSQDVLGASTGRSLWSYIASFFHISAPAAPAASQHSILQTTPTPISAQASTTDLTKLPLGDGRHSSTAPQKGYVYTCQSTFTDRGGAGLDGPWIHTSTSTWDATSKISVGGRVSWPGAQWKISSDGTTRTMTSNGYPTGHTTGIFPIQSTDPAYTYDRNPNSIKSQSLTIQVPVNPTIQTSPQCIFGEVGIMLSGIPLYDALDAGGRDAPAHELQDDCQGHPQVQGQYHYHSLSSCLHDSTDTHGASDLLGYALDGFGIYGPRAPDGHEYTTAELDECHGMTSEITWEGHRVNMYHYVMTHDFPYSVSCFRGKRTVNGPLGSAPGSLPPPRESINGSISRPGNPPPFIR